MHNLKSRNKPFIVFEPGDRMEYLRDMNIENLAKPGSCNHWPEGLIPCDGRTGRSTDRATSFLGFPISNPVRHAGETRERIYSLYGMTDRPFDEILPLARSWSKPPALKVVSGGLTSEGFDPSQRAYVLAAKETGRPVRAELALSADAGSPVNNFCLLIKGWGDEGATVSLDGKALTRKDGLRLGVLPTLTGADLVVWIEAKSSRPVGVVLTPGGE
jgi:hypothetical protein